FGAEAAATSGNSNNNASNNETVSRSLQYLRDEYHDLSRSNSGVVDQLKALSRRLNKLSAEVTRVGNAIDEVEEYSYQFNVKIIGLPEKSSETAAEISALIIGVSETKIISGKKWILIQAYLDMFSNMCRHLASGGVGLYINDSLKYTVIEK
ncbi:unnamed protein product, partial [Porites evermanni]